MKKKRKVCVVSSSRADYNHLYTLMSNLKVSSNFTLQLIVTGMHLLPQYGSTYKEILADGFTIDGKIKSNQKDTKKSSILDSIGNQLQNCANILNKLKSDMIILLGDRYDILPIAIACHICRIPLVHIHGGEVTHGVIDDSIRHMITKMADLHLVADKNFKRRVIQLGENPKKIFNIGSLGVDAIKETKFQTRKKLYQLYRIPNKKDYIIISLHPETTNNNNKLLITNLLKALEHNPQYFYIFTYPNSDTDSDTILKSIKSFIKRNNASTLIKSAGRTDYLSLVKYSYALIGNSSSGLVEAPALNIPSINIGNRQAGRPVATSVLSCDGTIKQISKALRNIYMIKKNKTVSYKGKNKIKTILKILQTINLSDIKSKKFYDINQ
tara:strand:- start:3037 stop:4185 length:1149 start_codon:yes stop_codon:yes gene_type:complete